MTRYCWMLLCCFVLLLPLFAQPDPDMQYQDTLNAAQAAASRIDTREAERLLALAVQQVEVLDEDNPHVVTCLRTVGRKYSDWPLQNFIKAEAVLTRAVAIQERLFGANDLRTADVLSELASYACHPLGKLDEEDQLMQRVLHIREQAWGEHDPRLISVLTQLAWSINRMAKPGEAHSYVARILAIANQAYQADDEKMLQVLNGLLGQEPFILSGEEALTLNTRRLRLAEKLYAGKPAEMAGAYESQAIFFATHSRYPEAINYCQRALAIREVTLKQDDRANVDLLHKLAYDCRMIGRIAEGEPTYLRLIALYTGPNPPAPKDRPRDWPLSADIDPLFTGLSELYREAGQPAKAEAVLQESITRYEQRYELETREGTATLYALATFYRAQVQPEKAEAIYRRAIHLRERVFGPDSAMVWDSRQELAKYFISRQRYDEALAIYTSIRDSIIDTQGPDGQSLRYTEFVRAEVLEARGEFDEAARIYEKYLQPLADVNPIANRYRHPNCVLYDYYRGHGQDAQAAVLEKKLTPAILGKFYLQRKNYARAIPLLTQASDDAEHNTKSLNYEVELYTALDSLATAYLECGQPAQAAPLLARALPYLEHMLSADSYRLVEPLLRLADSYRQLRQYPDAEKMYARALDIQQGMYGPTHPRLRLVLTPFAVLLGEMGKSEQAKAMTERAAALHY